MESSLLYLGLVLLVFLMNTLPALMPPTWVVLAFFYIHFNLALFPAVVLGALSAVLGRICLAKLSGSYLRPFIPKGLLDNYDTLGNFFHKHQRATVPFVLTYAFLPIPSNQVFIIAGITKLRLRLIASSFLAGRLISYTFWVSLANVAVDRFEDIFTTHLHSTNTILVEVIGFMLLVLIGVIPWKRFLGDNK